MFRRKDKPHIARFGGKKLLYRTYGSGPALVLVHGLSGSASWWKRNIPALKPHFTVYVVELVGYGNNRALRPTRIVKAADILAQFIAGLPPGRAHVIGHSMGGQIAMHLAAQHPERIDRLVLAAASGLVGSDLIRMALRLPSAGWHSAPDFVPTLILDALRAGPINLLLSALDILSNDVTEALRSIVAPTLLVWGKNDTLVPVMVGEAVHQTIANSRLEIIDRAGHVVMWDRAAQFNQVVLDFLLQPEPSLR